ncbi:MAG TPA: protein kinase family protein [Mycobacteriales bacterium]|nr:protein kinase family protein [Mycobacteriales bacterium]
MAERTVAGPDLLLAGRYRLLRPVTRHRVSTLWRGADEVLARPVAVRTLDRPGVVDGGKPAFLAAAVAAGQLGHPRIASVYDAADEDGLAYVVSEWVDGGSLAALLHDGPLPPGRATNVVAQVAEAIAHAHSHGVPHLDLDAHNVLLCTDGSTKVTDFRLGALLRAAAGGSQAGLDHAESVGSESETLDVLALGALLYVCLTARSAYGAEPELAVAPRRDGRLLSPRQVRAGVPRELDAVVSRILLPPRPKGPPPLTSAAGVVSALAPLPGEGPGTALPSPADVGSHAMPRRLSRWVTVGAPTVVMLALGAAALALGYSIGELPRPPGAISPLEAPASAVPNVPEASGAAARIAAVNAFDPPPGDGQERNQTVPLATDGDPSTAWETVKYRTEDFGRLKGGVGLLFDLGSPVKVRSVELAFTARGVSVELRSAATRGARLADYRVVASKDDATERETLRPAAAAAPARYWLVWITELVAADGGRFHAGVAEVAFGR